jgi:hypothetical protein
VNCLGWESVEGGKLEETGKRAWIWSKYFLCIYENK